MEASDLSSSLKKIRQAKGFTQGQLARLAGISLGHMIRLESNRKTNPTMETLRKLCLALEVPLQTFLPAGENQKARAGSHEKLL